MLFLVVVWYSSLLHDAFRIRGWNLISLKGPFLLSVRWMSVCSVVLKCEGLLSSFSHQTWSETVHEDSMRVMWTVIVSVIDPQRKAAVQIRLWKRPRHRLCPEHPGQRWAVARGVSWSEWKLCQVGSRPSPHRIRHSPGDAENPQPG